MRVGIIAPMREEIGPLIKELKMEKYKTISMVELYYKELDKLTLFACSGGICKTNIAVSTQVLIREGKPDSVILLGVSGALNPDLEIGDVVLSTALIHHDVADEILTKFHPYMSESWIYSNIKMRRELKQIAEIKSRSYRVTEGKIATGEYFVHDERRKKILEQFSPDCVDMESAAFAQVCYLNQLPFIVIRAMSDKANEESHENFVKNYKQAAQNSMQIVKEYICYLKEKV